MRTLKKILTKVNGHYGAPYGRPNIGVYPERTTVYDSAVPLSQGYDSGGAYWGIGEQLRVAYTADMSYVRFYRTDWFLTDRATNRWGRQLAGKVYKFRYGNDPEVTIELKNYTTEQIEKIINSYGYTQFEPTKYCMNIYDLEVDPNAIIAECIFRIIHH